MENSPWLDPRFLLAAGVVAVGFIAWLLRGEFKSSANATRQDEFEEATLTREAEIVKKMDELKAEHREVKKAYYSHAADTKVHHNEEMFKEFRQGLERRFTGVENTLQDISRKLDVNIHKTQG